MEAGMDDAVHVEIEIVELETVRVWTAQIDWDPHARFDLDRRLLQRVRHRLRVSVR